MSNLKEVIRGMKKCSKKFKPRYTFDKQFKTVTFISENVPFYGEYVDKYITILKAFDDHRTVGYINYSLCDKNGEDVFKENSV